MLPTALPRAQRARCASARRCCRRPSTLNEEIGDTFDALNDLVDEPEHAARAAATSTTHDRGRRAAARVRRAVPDGLHVRQLLLRRPRRPHLRGHARSAPPSACSSRATTRHAGQPLERLPGRPPGRRAGGRRPVRRLHAGRPGARGDRPPGRAHAAVRAGDRRAGQRRLPDRQLGLHRRPARPRTAATRPRDRQPELRPATTRGGSHVVADADTPGLAGPTFNGVPSLKDVP